MSIDDLEQKNKKTVRGLLLLVFVMILFAVALIPLYDILCEIAGINGKTRKSSSDLSYTVDLERTITLEFMTSTGSGTHMQFKAEHYEIKAHPGEAIKMRYVVTNKTQKSMLARARASITPGPAAEYIKITECFCFESQTFTAGETKHFEVQMVVDPDLPLHYKRMTLGLTFYEITKLNRG